jgi:hypothetical protein
MRVNFNLDVEFYSQILKLYDNQTNSERNIQASDLSVK